MNQLNHGGHGGRGRRRWRRRGKKGRGRGRQLVGGVNPAVAQTAKNEKAQHGGDEDEKKSGHVEPGGGKLGFFVVAVGKAPEPLKATVSGDCGFRGRGGRPEGEKNYERQSNAATSRFWYWGWWRRYTHLT